jgi:hypothetical protein
MKIQIALTKRQTVTESAFTPLPPFASNLDFLFFSSVVVKEKNKKIFI